MKIVARLSLYADTIVNGQFFRLTAFAAKTLHLGRFGEWERQLFIPLDLLNRITLYICSRQNETTGAFIPDNEPAYDYKMVGIDCSKLKQEQ